MRSPRDRRPSEKIVANRKIHFYLSINLLLLTISRQETGRGSPPSADVGG